jgi:penicillin amidase
MKTLFKLLAVSLLTLLIALLLAAALGYGYARGKLPQRDGELYLRGLAAPVQVRWDERGVPHIQARNETDLYRALGFLHAQDRLFQMELMRRLAKGELAEILGPKLLETDKLFRTLGLRAQAEVRVRAINPRHPSWPVLQAYLDGINEFQETRPLPLEFEILGIQNPLPYSAEDTLAVTGYLAYSFAAALRTEPVLTYVRDRLGPDYLRIFDVDWNPLGVLSPQARLLGQAGTDQDKTGKPQPQHPPLAALSDADWRTLARVGEVSREAMELAGVPVMEGSNAWAIAGQRTASGKTMLAGDPHIAFSLPAVWWEAHLTVPAAANTPGFELYGHFQALSPYALLGHNSRFGWSLTMFQNDDMDLVALRPNPANPRQVWYQGQWVDLGMRQEVIEVKGGEPEPLQIRQSPYGPVINQMFADTLGTSASATPIALWWALYEAENPIIEAFYELNRADTLAKARQAASKLHVPGLNIVWANAAGDIGWWAAAKLVQRPAGVNPTFILDSTKGQADKPGYYRFADNPQEENPARGYIVSGNQQPLPRSGVPVYGYYNNPERTRRLDFVLSSKRSGWTTADSQALQLDEQSDYPARILRPLLPLLREAVQRATDNTTEQKVLVDQLGEWDGRHEAGSITATVYNQFVYELARAALADELGPVFFNNLLRTRAIDAALTRLVLDENSPWWDDRETPYDKETRADTVALAWEATLAHLVKMHGQSAINRWAWSTNHQLTHNHPLGQVQPLHLLFNAGPYPVSGGHEMPNHLNHGIGPAPWSVHNGPSTRRVIDFAAPGQAQGINPVGQSGVLFDRHYKDQAVDYVLGRYYTMHLDADDVRKSTRSILVLQPDE